MMKKSVFVFMMMAAISISAYANDPMIVSGHVSIAPFSWQEGEKIVGASIDILAQIATDLGIEMESRFVGPWKRVLFNLEQGTIDVMCGLYATEDRKQFAEFTEYFAEDRVSIFVWHDRTFPFETWDDLEGKMFGDIIGATRGEEFDAWREKHATVEYVSDQLLNFKMLEKGRIDCIVMSHYPGLINIKQQRYEDKIVPLPQPLSIKYLRYGISKKSPYVSYLPQINEMLIRLREDGATEKIIQKNLDAYLAAHQ